MASKTPETFTTPFATYSVVRQLGEGGSGRVFAVTADDGESHAVKLLDPGKATRDKQRRFKNEILFGRTVGHDNIAPVTDYGVVSVGGKEAPFYVMPLYPATLRDRMKPVLPPETALRYFSQVLNGVEAAHLLAVWHRDLKPENVLVSTKDERAVVADFGIARFAPELKDTAIETQPNSRLANFTYASPEQRTGGMVDQRADIYALGLILHELFTGIVPHGTSYPPISATAPTHAYLDPIVSRMLCQNPADRFNSIDDTKKELIGRRNEYVSRQKLDTIRRTVVPVGVATGPDVSDPIRVVGGEWVPHELRFQLNRQPSPRWQEQCRDALGISFYANHPPRGISFSGTTATWRCDERLAQELINQFKQRVEVANREVLRSLTAEAARAEAQERERLEQAAHAEELRRRTNASLVF